MNTSGAAYRSLVGDQSPMGAALALGVSRQTIWKMIRDGKLPSYSLTGPNGARRIRVEAVQALRRGEDPFEAVRLADAPLPLASREWRDADREAGATASAVCRAR